MDRKKVIAWLADEELYYRDHVDTHNSLMACNALELLKEQPEIVRCKDCKHGSIYMTEDVCGKTLIECNHPELGDTIAIHAWDWFCSDGESKEGGKVE